jgi:hypothetical protein
MGNRSNWIKPAILPTKNLALTDLEPNSDRRSEKPVTDRLCCGTALTCIASKQVAQAWLQLAHDRDQTDPYPVMYPKVPLSSQVSRLAHSLLASEMGVCSIKLLLVYVIKCTKVTNIIWAIIVEFFPIKLEVKKSKKDSRLRIQVTS